jgi:uncharacterized protein YuzE
LVAVYKETRISLVGTYDSDADAAYIHLEHPIEPGASRRCAMIDPADGMFVLDLDADTHILGLEILGARRHLPAALLEAIITQ